ncbi:MAG: hypothetical protein M1814_005772 [Vezdaea aestivalis]|nr:MAG: hypothetical protein M1814_005772 [Vezdaea aestivalis]
MVANNQWDGYFTETVDGPKIDLEPDGILRGTNYYFQVPVGAEGGEGISRECLFAHFAWSMFCFIEGFLQSGAERVLVCLNDSNAAETRTISGEDCKRYTGQKGLQSRSASPKKRNRPKQEDMDESCDEQIPVCTQCSRGGRACPGYENDLRVLDQGPALARRYRAQGARSKSPKVVGDGDKQASAQLAKPIPTASPRDPFQCPAPTLDFSGLLPGLANRDQLLSMYICSIFPPTTADGSLQFTRNWLTQVSSHFGRNPALDLAAQSVITSYFGRLTSNTSFKHAGRKFYGQALQSLGSCLQHKTMGLSSETLAAVVLLNSYEMINCTSPNSWFHHAGGASRLIQLRGPQRHRKGFAYDILVGVRPFLIVEALAMSKPSFLCKVEWKELFQPPDTLRGYNRTSFDLVSEIYHILANITVLIHKGQEHCEVEGTEYRESIIELRGASSDWYGRFITHVGKPVEVPATDPSDIFPKSYQWDNRSFSAAGTMYHVVQLLLLEVSGRQDGEKIAEHVRAVCMNVDYAEAVGLVSAQYVCLALNVAWDMASTEQQTWIRKRLDRLGKFLQIAAEPVRLPVADVITEPRPSVNVDLTPWQLT